MFRKQMETLLMTLSVVKGSRDVWCWASEMTQCLVCANRAAQRIIVWSMLQNKPKTRFKKDQDDSKVKNVQSLLVKSESITCCLKSCGCWVFMLTNCCSAVIIVSLFRLLWTAISLWSGYLLVTVAKLILWISCLNCSKSKNSWIIVCNVKTFVANNRTEVVVAVVLVTIQK